MADPKRKAVRMWAYWHPQDSSPFWTTLRQTKRDAVEKSRSLYLYESRVICVEIRPVAPKKRSKKRGR